MRKYPIRLCSDGFGIEKEFANSRDEAIARFIELFDNAEKCVDEAGEGSSLSYRLCIDIGEYDEEY